MPARYVQIARLMTALALGLTVVACQRYEDRQASFEICHAEMTKVFHVRTSATLLEEAGFVRGCMAALGFKAASAPDKLCPEVDLAENLNCYSGKD